jgi:hypothetical protein
MTRDELVRIVKQSNANTLIARRMRAALGLPLHVPTISGGRTRDRSAKSRKYRNAKQLMRQKHGVRL